MAMQSVTGSVMRGCLNVICDVSVGIQRLPYGNRRRARVNA